MDYLDKNSIMSIVHETIDHVKLQILKFARSDAALLVREKLSDTASQIESIQLLQNHDISAVHLLPVIYILAGLLFLLCGKQIVRFAMALLGAFFGTVLVLSTTYMFNVNLTSIDPLNFTLAVIAVVISSMVWSHLFFQTFSTLFNLALYAISVFSSYKLALVFSETVVRHFEIEDKMVDVIYLRFFDEAVDGTPILGLVAFHVFFLLALFIASSIHSTISLTIATLYLFPIGRWSLSSQLVKLGGSSVGAYSAELPIVLTVAFTLLLLAEWVYFRKFLRSSVLLGLFCSVVGALFFGYGCDTLFAVLRPELYDQLAISDRGLGLRFSLLGAVFSVLTFLMGLYKQIN